METNLVPCPYCESVGRLINGHLCPACNGFKRVGEIGMRRANLYQSWDKKREQGNFNRYPVKDDWDGECPF